MATNTTSELATLTRLLNTPGLSALPVRVTIQGELQLEVNGPGPLDRIKVLLEGGVVTDLYAAVTDKGGLPSWLKSCTELFEAVQNGWLVLVNAQESASQVAIIQPQQTYIPNPHDPRVGDILVFNGANWIGLGVGPDTYVLTSNGAGFLPSYQPQSGGGGSNTPGGPNTAIQYKDGVNFAGSSRLTWNNSSFLLNILGSVTQTGEHFSVTSSEASVVGSDRLTLGSSILIEATADVALSGNITADVGGAGATVAGPVLTDTSKTWTVNAFVGNYVRVEMDDGSSLYSIISSNTEDNFTVEQPWIAVGAVSSYEIIAPSLRVRNVADPVLPHDVATKQWVETHIPSGGGNPSISGQTTTGLLKGNVCLLSGANTWSKARADLLTATTTCGVFNGVDGTVDLSGSTIEELLCTTDGGIPAVGAKLYLAVSTADGGTGEGKATAIPPSPPVSGRVKLQTVGICVDNTNYAASKTVKAVFQPSYPTILVG